MTHSTHPLVLIILDGWGHTAASPHNAITLAKTPVWDHLMANSPHTFLSASGLDVGLPPDQMGNSEVGHMTIGAGRVIYQDLTKINLAVQDGSFFKNPVLVKALQTTASTPKQALHIMGLVSPGGIHSHEMQIYALIQMAAQNNCGQVYIHAFLDGRDTPPKSAATSLTALQAVCAKYGAEIASIGGRYYAMDRDQKYQRTQIAYDLLTSGTAQYSATTALAALELAYQRGETDEFVIPTKITTKNNNALIKDGDTVVFMNFRADRTKQLSYSLIDPDFTGFTRAVFPKLTALVTLTEYASDLEALVAFPKDPAKNSLGEYLAAQNLTQLRIAETEKYAHVTFFFNGGSDLVFKGETRELIASPKVATYDLTPAMSAIELTEKLITAITSQKFDVIIANFANADMVGHTGDLTATISAIEVLDNCLSKIIAATADLNGEILITADHGNAEQMYDSATKQAHTAHTLSLVPFVYVGARQLRVKPGTGTLADIAPTLLDLLGLTVPAEMTGKVLFDV